MKNSRLTLVFLDILAIYVALVLAVIGRGTIHNRAIQTASEWMSAHTIIFFPSLVFSLVAMYVAGLYDIRTLYDKSKVIPLVIYSQIATAIFAVLSFYFIHTELTPKLTLFLHVVFSIILLVGVRALMVNVLNSQKKGKAAYLSLDGIQQSLERFNQPYSLFILSQMSVLQFLKLSPKQRESFDAIVYEPVVLRDTNNFVAIEKFKKEGFLCISSEEYYEDLYKKVDLQTFDPEAFKVNFANKKEHAGHFLFRRFLDILAAIIILPFFIISLPVVLFMNFLFNKGDVFSIQHRIGYLGKTIWVYKLRTMLTTDTGGVMNSSGTALAHTQSGNGYTKIGNFWRRTRIDEFPQFVNLFRGDISIIGPRSDVLGVYREMTEKIDLYPLRLVVQQGLTGWAQVHMSKPPRTAEEHTERLAYELYYIKHHSVLLDISIILKTIKTMIARTGA